MCHKEADIAVHKRSRRTCAKMEGAKSRYRRLVVAASRVRRDGVKKKARGEKKREKGGESRYGKVERGGSTRVWCRDPDDALSSARTFESLLDSKPRRTLVFARLTAVKTF